MLIKDLSQLQGKPGVYDAEYAGEKLITRWVENNEPFQERVKVEKLTTDRGFTLERGFQHVASIPPLLFEKVSRRLGTDWFRDSRLLAGWLNSEEGQPYKIGNP